MIRQGQCWNAHKGNAGSGVISPQCYDNDYTHRVTIAYSEEPTDQDVLYLCRPCALAVRKDGRRHGYDVTIEKLNTQERGAV